jgi:hypothetical protein
MNETQSLLSTETDDFITQYVRLLARITDAPEEYQEAAALFLLSTVAGRRWIFRSLPETLIFSEKPGNTGRILNLWFILIGKSRVSRKTSVLNQVEDMLKEIFGERRSLSKTFTPEFLVKEMSRKSEHIADESETHCYWIKDEVAGFFKQLKRKDSYMADADDVLSTIYDGMTISRGTIGRDKETVHNPYLTTLLASTHRLPTLFDALQIELGFLNRFIYVVGERKQRKPLRKKPLDDEERQTANRMKDFLKALARMEAVTTIEMTGEAEQTYDSFEEEVERRIGSENLGIKEGYCGQLPNLVVRLSCLYRLSRMTLEEIRNYSNPMLAVEKQDVDRAIQYSRKAWKWFEEVIELMNTPRTNENNYGNLTNLGRMKVLELLKDGPKMRKHFLQPLGDIGVGHSLLDNLILRSLLRDGLIQQYKFGWYSLTTMQPSVPNDAGIEKHEQ